MSCAGVVHKHFGTADVTNSRPVYAVDDICETACIQELLFVVVDTKYLYTHHTHDGENVQAECFRAEASTS